MKPFYYVEQNECYHGHLGPVLLIYWRLYSVLVAQATPVIVDAGIDPVWFGIFAVIVVEFGLISMVSKIDTLHFNLFIAFAT